MLEFSLFKRLNDCRFNTNLKMVDNSQHSLSPIYKTLLPISLYKTKIVLMPQKSCGLIDAKLLKI